MNEDNRDYAKEAKRLIGRINLNQKYEMYGIVTDKLKFRNQLDDVRIKELEAVKEAIEDFPNIDYPRLMKIAKGYGKMADSK